MQQTGSRKNLSTGVITITIIVGAVTVGLEILTEVCGRPQVIERGERDDPEALVDLHCAVGVQ